jgi:hypothetical protein
MRKTASLAIALGAVAALSISGHAQAPTSQTTAIQPVVVKAGKSGYVSVSLTREPLDYGTITSITATTVSDVNADYTGLAGPLALQILTGANRGKTVQVTATSSHDISVAEDLTALAAVGDKFLLVNEWTLNTLLGNPGVGGSPSGLVGGSSFSTVSVDNVQLVNPTTGVVTTYFYKNTAPTGWRTSANPVTDVGNTRIAFNDGAIINRRTAGDVTLDLKGVARVGRTTKTLEANGGGHGGLNIVSITNPAGVTLDNSGLSTVITGTGGSFNSSTTDTVLVKNAAGDTVNYYFRTGVGGGWRLTSNPITNQGTVLIPAGSAVVIRRVAGSDTTYHQNQAIQP